MWSLWTLLPMSMCGRDDEVINSCRPVSKTLMLSERLTFLECLWIQCYPLILSPLVYGAIAFLFTHGMGVLCRNMWGGFLMRFCRAFSPRSRYIIAQLSERESITAEKAIRVQIVKGYFLLTRSWSHENHWITCKIRGQTKLVSPSAIVMF